MVFDAVDVRADDSASKPSNSNVNTEAKNLDAMAHSFHGSLTLDQSLGLGTFAEGAGELSRPYYNMLLSLRGSYRVPVPLQLSVGLRLDLDVNLVENYDSINSRSNQIQMGDCLLYTSDAADE